MNRWFIIFFALLAVLFSGSTDALGFKLDLSAGNGTVLDQAGVVLEAGAPVKCHYFRTGLFTAVTNALG